MYPSHPDNRKQKIITSFVLVLAVVLVIGGVNAYRSQKNTNRLISAMTTPTSGIAVSRPATTATNTASNFKDGTYSAASDYFVPPGTEQIKVTLTLKNNVVVDSQIANSESDGTSAQYQESFASVYKNYVVGRKVSDINLAYVAGASDTTIGFNDALQKIENQAKA